MDRTTVNCGVHTQPSESGQLADDVTPGYRSSIYDERKTGNPDLYAKIFRNRQLIYLFKYWCKVNKTSPQVDSVSP